ncbi:hypothetical protein LSAT2_001982 [Lamellibrachia satsuma]|nr:hypothetical protein LSAT2_001982 [Lamellibrachia satsuma]
MAAHSMYSDMTNLALTKLCLAADYYAAVSPALARFYVDKVDRMKEEFDIPPTAHHLRCQFCGAVFRPDNHLVRIKVQMKETRKIRQLQRHRDKPGQELGRFQQHLLDSYTNRKNRLTIRCEACNKRTTLWFVGEWEKTKEKRTGEDNPSPDMTKLSRSAKKKLKKKLKKKQKSETPSEDTVQSNSRSQPTSAAITHSTTQRSSELHNRSTLSSGPHSTKSYPRFLAASSQSKTAATTPSGGSLLAGLNSKSARNKKKRNKQSYNPLKEMLEKQKLDKNRPSGKGIMDLLMNIDK